MEQKKKVLVIVPQHDLFAKLEPILKRDSIEVSRSANATSSLILATNVVYDLIVAEYPLPDLSIVDFLGILQAPTLPCSETRILLITNEDQITSVAKHTANDDRVTVVPQQSSAQFLHSALADSLTAVAERKASRLMIQFEARLGAGKLMRICQTSNVSESGLLIHTTRLMPVETEMDVSFYLPGDPRPIDGTVRVVRHSDPDREEIAGMGVEFVHLPPGSREKLREFVGGRWIETEDLLADNSQPAADATQQRLA
jgi:hypothetical protein